MKKIFNLKNLKKALACGLLCSVFLSVADFDTSCEELRNNVLRLHIIANSDSLDDQQVKLQIRDAVLSESSDLFFNVTDISKATKRAEANIELFTDIANNVLSQEGYTYKARAYVGERYFETREYDNFTLPAGNYKSLVIELGDSEGKNWWCVIFPEVCIPAACGELSDTVNSEACEKAENPQKYEMRFKAVEIYQNIKKFIKL